MKRMMKEKYIIEKEAQCNGVKGEEKEILHSVDLHRSPSIRLLCFDIENIHMFVRELDVMLCSERLRNIIIPAGTLAFSFIHLPDAPRRICMTFLTLEIGYKIGYLRHIAFMNLPNKYFVFMIATGAFFTFDYPLKNTKMTTTVITFFAALLTSFACAVPAVVDVFEDNMYALLIFVGKEQFDLRDGSADVALSIGPF
ncbi:hypothetical protein BDF20DRAFT_834438 [Mycotypha africana]|uniref:uncharacterized protein n=1 Tax=Mycotypha africana TaxID=64632 RepID=UPI002301226C|nr:uncharacterized protein BDF20DRAFT_834438 [Mycotypha africana]KAI8981750.1 hypothetical protein BDF20DRAFT_834438 [Mycotypha africana]